MADEGVAIRLQPRAGRDAILGERDGAVLIRVSAPPVDGRANQALCRLIADRVGVPKSAVEIIRGAGARDKVVRVDGWAAIAVRAALLAG